jgi:hypothetical protein
MLKSAEVVAIGTDEFVKVEHHPRASSPGTGSKRRDKYILVEESKVLAIVKD